MQAIREMIKAKNKDCHISLPEWAVGLDLEVIILPANKQRAAATRTGKAKEEEHYNFSGLSGRLKWSGNAVQEQRKMRDEW